MMDCQGVGTQNLLTKRTVPDRECCSAVSYGGKGSLRPWLWRSEVEHRILYKRWWKNDEKKKTTRGQLGDYCTGEVRSSRLRGRGRRAKGDNVGVAKFKKLRSFLRNIIEPIRDYCYRIGGVSRYYHVNYPTFIFFEPIVYYHISLLRSYGFWVKATNYRIQVSIPVDGVASHWSSDFGEVSLVAKAGQPRSIYGSETTYLSTTTTIPLLNTRQFISRLGREYCSFQSFNRRI